MANKYLACWEAVLDVVCFVLPGNWLEIAIADGEVVYLKVISSVSLDKV
jgi:hypothetical protein